MYRPEGLNTRKVAHNILASKGIVFPTDKSMTDAVDLVEAGADAMLEGLRKGGRPGGWMQPDTLHHETGCVVWIPDDEVFIPEEANSKVLADG